MTGPDCLLPDAAFPLNTADPGVFQAWIGATDDGAIAVGADGRVVLHNPAASRVTGLSAEQALHQPWQDVMGLERQLAREAWRVRTTQMPARIVAEIICAQGNRRATEIQVSPWRDTQGAIGILIVIRDLATLCRQRTVATGRAGYGNLVGAHPAMQAVYELIDAVAASDAPVIVEGETGSGKALIAQLLHARSKRATRPLIVFDCEESSRTEAQLFGRRGTRQHQGTPGRFEAADGGTLVLAEVGRLPLASQAHLLEPLQSGTLIRAGESRARSIDVRLVVTTRISLETAAREGRFRDDLLVRLRVVRIAIPPLRERLSDLPLLVDHFLALTGSRAVVTPAALTMLGEYQWPGNVAELEQVIRHAVALHPEGTLGPDQFPAEVRRSDRRAPIVVGEPGGAERRALLLQALAGEGGNRSAAARSLGIGRATFYRWWKEAGLGLFPGRGHR